MEYLETSQPTVITRPSLEERASVYLDQRTYIFQQYLDDKIDAADMLQQRDALDARYTPAERDYFLSRPEIPQISKPLEQSPKIVPVKPPTPSIRIPTPRPTPRLSPTPVLAPLKSDTPTPIEPPPVKPKPKRIPWGITSGPSELSLRNDGDPDTVIIRTAKERQARGASYHRSEKEWRFRENLARLVTAWNAQSEVSTIELADFLESPVHTKSIIACSPQIFAELAVAHQSLNADAARIRSAKAKARAFLRKQQ